MEKLGAFLHYGTKHFPSLGHKHLEELSSSDPLEWVIACVSKEVLLLAGGCLSRSRLQRVSGPGQPRLLQSPQGILRWGKSPPMWPCKSAAFFWRCGPVCLLGPPWQQSNSSLMHVHPAGIVLINHATIQKTGIQPGKKSQRAPSTVFQG